MNIIALYTDYFLYFLVAITFALIIYKVFHLYFPQVIGLSPLSEQLNCSTKKELEIAVEQLEKGMALLAVIATAAPFVGLAGTVMHIIEALKGMSSAGADISIISGPIAVALNATLIGIASAIPALVAYNLLGRRLQMLENSAARNI